MCHDAIIDLYERHVQLDHDRSRTLQEKPWLDRFVSCLEPSAVVLDLG